MQEGKQYNISLRWDEKEHTYIASADDLPGVTGKGNTREHALAAVQDAIRWWLESGSEGTRRTESPAEPENQPPR
ncbi:MAG TPA: type II toxin-antitoxin system HicB family antitoxin [Ktedonobacterales bacterium]|nr:type II toxin-antitoxin system HicB family antitoxin [Ktedonobacterales bacterium]